MGEQVKQSMQKQEGKSYFQQILLNINKRISQTSIAQLILNYNHYHKWPKRIYNYYAKLTSDVVLDGALKSEIQKLMANIFQRLSLLGNYGNVFINKIRKEMGSFCPSFNNNNWSTDYRPSEMDKQLKKIAQCYQSQYKNVPNNQKCKIQAKYQNNKMLAQIQERIKVFYEFQRKKTVQLQQLQKEQNLVNYILGPKNQGIQFVDRNCLRCTTHFILNSSTNACHPSISFFPVDAYQLSHYQTFNNIENNVRASMCQMLNQPSGGIILIGCEKQGTTIIPKGLFITQKDKDSLQQKIEGYFAKILPKVKRGQEVFIDFVPIMQIRQNSQIDQKDQKYKMEAKEGMYICRIFLLASSAYKVYLLKANAEHSTLQARINNQSLTIPDSQHYSYMIQKFEKIFESKEKSGIIYCHYTIKCCQAHEGRQAFAQKKQEQTLLKEEQKYSKQKQSQLQSSKKNQKPKQNAIKSEQQYKFWTLVVGDKQAMQKLKQCVINKQNKNIKIEKMFQQAKFKLLKTTWIMFHDEKFEALKKIAQKHNITYKGKELKMIASNLYLQVEGSIEKSQYQTLIDTISNKFGSGVKQFVQKIIDGKKCLLLYFSSLKGSIYAYFQLSDLGYKVKFIRGASHFKDSQNVIQQSVFQGSGETGFNDQTGYNIQMQQQFNPNISPYLNQYDNIQGYSQYAYYPYSMEQQQLGYDPQTMYQNYPYNYYQQGYPQSYPQGYPQGWQTYYYNQYNNGGHANNNDSK